MHWVRSVWRVSKPDVGVLHAPRRPLHGGRQAQAKADADGVVASTKPLLPPPSSPATSTAAKSLPAPGPARADPIPVANNLPTLPLWQRLGPLTRAADSYARAQRRRPYLTQLASSLVIALCADLSVQRMNAGQQTAKNSGSSGSSDNSDDSPRYDPRRTVRSLTIGAISSIPSYKWFLFLSYNFNYASRALSLATKVIVNQLVFTPVFNSYFFGMQALLSGETLAATWAHVRRTVPVSFVNSWKVWPAVQTFSFTFVPVEYRSVFSGVVAVGWQTYLMYLQRRAEVEEHAAPAAPAAPTAAKSSLARPSPETQAQ